MNGDNNFLKNKLKIRKNRDLFFIILAFSIVAIFFLAPSPEGLTHNGQAMIGILIMAAILWITEPIPLAVTGLLIMIMQPLLHVLTPGEVFSSFGNQAVFFLIGAFILAGAVEKHGLHRRIALLFLSKFEKSPRFFTLGIMTSCAFLSFVMPEHGVAALFLPIVISILIAMKIVPKRSNFGKISMLCIAYGCSIGSLGTLIGGARNPLTIGVLSDLSPPINVTFVDWMIYSMPVVFITLPLVWLVLQFAFPIELKDISAAKREIKNQVAVAGRIKKNELLVLLILIITILLWILFSSHQYFGLAVIAVLGSVLLFLTGSITWSDIEKRVPWGIILLYGGAITLGIGIQETGAGKWIADIIFNMAGFNPYVMILVMIIITILLTNVMSNIGAVAILLPIGIALAPELGISPLLASMVIALSGGLAFMLVIATPGNAITYSSGYYSTKDLFKAGSIANILCIVIIFIVATTYWMGVLGI
ncbi:MAG: DASS family sodium-coupled anion symporter, partial [Thermoplasmatales archaeon]|nr:DASS family sodium-coupled anion symporter [Thermoplasmatales archaeon]MCK5636510.1 DASS family sodium-coupled anion symporter [Thermoplasmatales archaeon]